MIESSFIKIHPDTGILSILVNTKDRWVDYQINRISEEGKIQISFFYDIENQPGCFEEHEEREFIDISKDFNHCDYLTTSMQEKDQIHIICVPNKIFRERKFIKYGTNS